MFDKENPRGRSFNLPQSVFRKRRVIPFIHDEDVIRRDLKHQTLWGVKLKQFQRDSLPLRMTENKLKIENIDC